MTEPDREVLDRLIRIETMLYNMVERKDDHESRLRDVEHTMITREELDGRQVRTLRWVALIVSVLGIVVSAVVSILIATAL